MNGINTNIQTRLNLHGVWASCGFEFSLSDCFFQVVDVLSAGLKILWDMKVALQPATGKQVVWRPVKQKALLEVFFCCSWHWLQQLLKIAFLLPLGSLLTLMSFSLTYSGTYSHIYLSPFLLTAITILTLCRGKAGSLCRRGSRNFTVRFNILARYNRDHRSWFCIKCY